jgi:hypothetical protein
MAENLPNLKSLILDTVGSESEEGVLKIIGKYYTSLEYYEFALVF